VTTIDHITDALIRLHWLRVPERIQYKLQAVLVYKVLHGDASRYLGPLTRVDDLPGRRTLRSTNANRLVVPSPVKLLTVNSRQPSLCGYASTRLEYTAEFKEGGKLGSCPGPPQLRGLHKKQ